MSVDFQYDEGALTHLLDDPTGPVGQEMERRALFVEAAQKRLLSQHGTGVIYRRHGGKVTHQASAPGEPPAPDTGLLRASVSHHVGVDADGMYAEIGSGASPDIPGLDYGVYLDVGTHDIEPRPWLRPSLTAAEQ